MYLNVLEGNDLLKKNMFKDNGRNTVEEQLSGVFKTDVVLVDMIKKDNVVTFKTNKPVVPNIISDLSKSLNDKTLTYVTTDLDKNATVKSVWENGIQTEEYWKDLNNDNKDWIKRKPPVPPDPPGNGLAVPLPKPGFSSTEVHAGPGTFTPYDDLGDDGFDL